MLVEMLIITTGEEQFVPSRRGVAEKRRLKTINEYPDDETGEATLNVLTKALRILSRITGNSARSLGLHPAVYFYNERGRHSSFLFLAMIMLITERVDNNDDLFFKNFSLARACLEKFLIENKSLISTLLRNITRTQRVPSTRDLLSYLVSQLTADAVVTPEMAISHLGLRGRVFDADVNPRQQFSDDVKSIAFIQNALESALRCPICDGLLDPTKSVSYDHRVPRRDDGGGEVENVQLAHPYCNTGIKS